MKLIMFEICFHLTLNLQFWVQVTVYLHQWIQAALPIRYRDLELRRMLDLGFPAFLVSAHGVASAVTVTPTINGDEANMSYMSEAISAAITKSTLGSRV